MAITLKNKDMHAAGALGIFVFDIELEAVDVEGTHTAVTEYDLSPFLSGYQVVGGAFSAGSAGAFASIDAASKKVTTHAGVVTQADNTDPENPVPASIEEEHVCFTVFALRRGGA